MQMVLFTMGERYYVTSAEYIEEVIDTTTITPVPLSEPSVAGLINLRGMVMTVIDLATLLSLPRSEQNRNILVMRKENEKKGLLIEEVIEVLTIHQDDIKLSAKEDSLYLGVVSIDDKVASIIDITNLIFV